MTRLLPTEMSMKNTFTAIAGVWAVLLVARIVTSTITNLVTELTASSGAFAWGIAADLLAAIAIASIARRSTLHGWQLATAVSGFYFGIHGVNAVEAVAYLDIKWSLALQVLIAGVVAIPAWKFIFGREPACAAGRFPWAQRSRSSWAARLIVANVAYLLIYISAGLLVYPHVKEFYSTQAMPPFSKIVVLQLLIRGPVFVGLCLLLVRMLPLSRARTSIMIGFIFATVSGIIPLMVPNPFLPEAVRFAHLCEVVGSNFLFAALVARLLWLDQRPKETACLDSSGRQEARNGAKVIEV
jgi:hypothetical protein